MRNWMQQWSFLATPCLMLALLLQGCSFFGPQPDIASEEKKPGQKYSSAEVRRMTVDQPFLVSGDYFRERNQEAAAEKEVAMPELGGKDKDKDDQAAPKTDQQAKAADAPAGQAQVAEKKEQPGHKKSAAGYRLKVGLLLNEQDLSMQEGRALMQASGRAAKAKAVVLIDDPELREVLAPTECLKTRNQECLADTLALYPGLRMLLLAESLELPKSYPGKAALRMELLDAGLVRSYPAMELSRTVKSKEEAASFLEQAVGRALSRAASRAATMPRHARVFSVKQKRIFISAGQETGLSLGKTFQVVPGGETVTAPTGTPIDWIPEDPTATIRVERFVAGDAAACSLIDGDLPEQGDFVLLESAGK